MPVMEGKCALFKAFADVDAFPLCIRLQGCGRDRRHGDACWPAALAASTWRTFPPPAALRSSAELKEVLRYSRFSTTTSTAPPLCAGRGLLNAHQGGRQEDWQDCDVVINGAGAAGIAIAKLPA